MFEHLKKIYAYIFKRENLKTIGICLAVLSFLWFAIFGDQGLYQLHKSIKLKKELREDIVRLKDRIEHLKQNKKLLNDKDHLELVIRQELGYVKPGEVVFHQMIP